MVRVKFSKISKINAPRNFYPYQFTKRLIYKRGKLRIRYWLLHKKVMEYISEFFWSCIVELAPFGSDEGEAALTEFRNWYKQYPKTPTIECLKWVIESVGEMNFKEYNQELLERDRKKEVIENEDYDDQQYLCTLDNSVIATGFAQLVDEGLIEVANKPIIQLAISRQIIGAELSPDWEHADQYIDSLKVLDRVLKLV